MKIILKISSLFLILVSVYGYAPAQTQEPAQKTTNDKNLASQTGMEIECPKFQKKAGEDNAGFYAVVRYVIVYNEDVDFLAFPERRMDILMNPEQLNEENLRCVFKLIDKQYPTPESRIIRVHTTLATIQTPEELKLGQRSDDPRFSDVREKSKTALYIRYTGGREVFNFTVQLASKYEKRSVILVDK